MVIFPVLDLLNGVVVRGVAGKRETYRPIQSRISASADPLAIARAFREHFGLQRLYVADLDAIVSQRPNLKIYGQLARDGFQLLVDAGIRSLSEAEAVIQAGADSIIAGLESTASPAFLHELVARCGPDRVVFSLDLQAGRPLTASAAWGGMSPIEIASTAFQQGILRFIVLDLAQVGIGAGVSTLDLCRQLRGSFPDVEIITGGGVRSGSDLCILRDLPVDGVLIASALHDGRLSRADLDRCSQRPTAD